MSQSVSFWQQVYIKNYIYSNLVSISSREVKALKCFQLINITIIHLFLTLKIDY